jgi:asparagine N-glycosylation enzyme membrane subunit Stt3
MDLPIKKIPLSVIRIALVVLLVTIFSLKVFFSFQTPFFDDPRSYYHLSQIQHVAEHGLPSYISEYHYLEKPLAVPPGYYLIMGFLYSIFNSITFLKIIDALLLVGIIFMVYILGVMMASSVKAGFFAALLSSVMPLIFISPQNILRPLYMSVFFILVFFYIFLKSNSLFEGNESFSDARFMKIITLLIVLTFFIALLGSSVLFLVLVLIFYISFKIINKSHIKIYLREISIFVTLVVVGLYFLIYRSALATHGVLTFWNNVPLQYYREYLSLFSITNSLGLINIVIVLGGFYAIYYYFTQESYSKEKQYVLFCSSGVFASLVLALISTGNPEFIFFMAGIMLALCLSVYIKGFISHANINYKFNINQDMYWVSAIIIVVVIGSLFNISLIAPSSVSHIKLLSLNDDLIDVLEWSRLNTPEDSLIFATPEHGYIIEYFAQRRYILDSDFLFVPYPTRDIQNLNRLYKGIFLSDAPFVVQQYLSDNASAAYVLYDAYIQSSYEISYARFIDSECFTEIYARETASLYRYGCEE